MNKTLSRIVIEAAIVAGALSIAIGIIQKLTHLSSVYAPHFLGLTTSDFVSFGQVCFLFSIALAVRRVLKHMEYALRPGHVGWKDQNTQVTS